MISLIIIGKLVIWFSRIFNLGNGSTWPGEIMLRLYPDAPEKFFSRVKKGIIFIAGTNGKTTTAKMVTAILTQYYSAERTIPVIVNDSGANLLNGIISAFIGKSSLTGDLQADYVVFEVDEATLPQVIKKLPENYQGRVIVAILNLFRDQLDRYGEVDTVARNWAKVLPLLPKHSVVILNTDDPQIAYLGFDLKKKIVYFGIDKPDKFLKVSQHAADSIFCRVCGEKLDFSGTYFSHIGIWNCNKCGNTRPRPDISGWDSPLPGLYNEYNTLASVAVSGNLGIPDTIIKKAFSEFYPAFGRQEEFTRDGKHIKLFLSKNPAGFNASLRTVIDLDPKAILMVLNDRIPDGRDVSWIWDADFEMIPEKVAEFVSGERCYDLGLRIKYTMKQFNNETMKQLSIIENLSEAIDSALRKLNSGETLYILPTYSAMLQVRKILGGRAIL
jgi:lipid II isoglutaminyl synthase (glutamine-hydrolysing)